MSISLGFQKLGIYAKQQHHSTRILGTSSRSTPPSIPSDNVYTPYYCEENIYLLAKSFSADPQVVGTWDVFILFISNHNKAVALWCQQKAHEPHLPVVWDYHVILILRPRNHLGQNVAESGVVPLPLPEEKAHTWAYDFDTCLDLPCTLQEYLDWTFRDVNPQYQSLFRVIPCEIYLNHFASDRSHMLTVKEDELTSAVKMSRVPDDYCVPPPVYEPICGAMAFEHGVSNNLMASFVCMDLSEDTYGDVVLKDVLRLWCDSVT